jgi:FkbM family methyltransferase
VSSKGLIAVGAWDGREYVAEARHHSRPLLLFEPQADPFRRLVDNLGAFEDVTLVNVALGARRGVARMHKAHPDHSSSILAPKTQLDLYPDITFSGETERVRVATLDGVIQNRGLVGLYDEMMIDVQGYELEVLRGGKRTLRDIEKIVCEVNWDEVYEGCAHVDEVDAFLEPFGFTRTGINEHVHGSCGDAFYVK